MIKLILSLGLVPFLITAAGRIDSFWRAFRSVHGGLFWLCTAWTFMFIGQAQYLPHTTRTVEDVGNLDAGHFWQITFMALAAVILLLLYLNMRISVKILRLPMIGLLIYGFEGLATAGYSPAPELSVYKSAQLLLDFLMLVCASAYIINSGRRELLLNLTYFWLAIIVAGAAIGGILFPEAAFTTTGGVFGGFMKGLFPYVHGNELGLLAAIVMLVGLSRIYEDVTFRERIFWASHVTLGFSVLFFAQARTSLATSSVGLLLMSLLNPRLRWLGAILFILITGSLVIYWLSAAGFGVEDVVKDYLRRGATDEQLETLSGRLVLWQIGWEMFKDSPILGHGMDAGVRVGGTAYGLIKGTNMHSAHMQVLVNSGIVGYLAWALLIFGIAWRVVIPTLRYHIPVRTFEDRRSLEVCVVLMIMLGRSLLGQVLVTHQFTTMILFSMYIYTLVPRVNVLQTAGESKLDKLCISPSNDRILSRKRTLTNHRYR